MEFLLTIGEKFANKSGRGRESIAQVTGKPSQLLITRDEFKLSRRVERRLPRMQTNVDASVHANALSPVSVASPLLPRSISSPLLTVFRHRASFPFVRAIFAIFIRESFSRRRHFSSWLFSFRSNANHGCEGGNWRGKIETRSRALRTSKRPLAFPSSLRASFSSNEIGRGSFWTNVWYLLGTRGTSFLRNQCTRTINGRPT